MPSLQADFGLTPFLAIELEFYLFGADQRADDAFWQRVRARFHAQEIVLTKIEKEKGAEQWEVALHYTSDIEDLIRQTEQCKTIVSEEAALLQMQASFAAKPLANEPGSGLHVHIHLEDTNSNNVYWKRDDEMADALKRSLGGLIACMKEDMPIFAPTHESQARFTTGSNAPTTLSWGANNRTVALRLPDSPADNKRIEHRVAGSDADSAAVIDVILKAIHHGLTHQCDPGPQMYGDAGLPIYTLEKLIA